MNEYITIQEVMKMLKVSRTTVYTWIKSGKLKSTRVGRLVRISADDLSAFMGERKHRRKGEERKNVETLNRDSMGQFLPPGKMDAKQKIWQKHIKEENTLAKTYIEICEKIGHPELTHFLEIHRYPQTGHWRVPNWVEIFFRGFALGAMFVRKEIKDKKKILSVLELVTQAGKIRRNIWRLENGYYRLVRKEH